MLATLSAVQRIIGTGAPTMVMTHIAIQEAQNGKVVEWMEQVSDEEYLVGPAFRPLSPVLP